MASRKVFISGIHLYRPMMMGSRRSSRTRMASTIRRQILSGLWMSLNEANGIHAPTYTNADTLNKRSMTELKTASSVCLLKNPSQAKATPHAKHARRSSDPRRVVTPSVSMAREMYCATYDSRSMRLRRWQNFMRCRKPKPRRAPMRTPRMIWSADKVVSDLQNKRRTRGTDKAT